MADNRILASIVRKRGGKLLDAAIGTLLPSDAQQLPTKEKTLLAGLVGTVALRVATRSVPGAIVVGGAMLAKRHYDKRRVKAAGKAAPKA